jgi:hypothetical protein
MIGGKVNESLSQQTTAGERFHYYPLLKYLYRLDKQYSPISATASLYYLFDTIGIYTD